jgi:hypothetical protein
VSEKLEIHGGSEVVGIRNSHVLDAGGKELFEASRADECGVEVAVPGRAPFVGRIRRTRRGEECSGVKFGDLGRGIVSRGKCRKRMGNASN